MATKAGSDSREIYKKLLKEAEVLVDEDGTPEEQEAFLRELESFYQGKCLQFKCPNFYGIPLNCLKLWRAVTKLGGYHLVTESKLWRQVGESFHPPKTCTTVSYTFRIFYEKALLDYEMAKTESGELQLAPPARTDASSVENEATQVSVSGRTLRVAAARARHSWHSERIDGSDEPKEKAVNNVSKREKNQKSPGSVERKRSSQVEHPATAPKTETSRQLDVPIEDVGPPADWVKINVRETEEGFEVYMLIPGLLVEEVRMQSDPNGRLVITGTPEKPDNPWGISAFKKVVTLPARIDPFRTSGVVGLHGRHLVRVPFERSSI